MVWIVSLRACMASPCRGWPFSPCLWSVSSNGVRFRCASNRWCAATPRRPPARPKRLPRRPKCRTPRGARGARKAARTPTRLPSCSPPELVRIKAIVEALLRLITAVLSVTYLVLDGHFGNHNALQMARQCNLHLISKLRCDAALYFPYVGPYAGRGPRRKYGRKVDYDNLPERDRQHTTVDGHIETRLYQAQLLHKEFTQPLNVVIIVKTNLRTQARAH